MFSNVSLFLGLMWNYKDEEEAQFFVSDQGCQKNRNLSSGKKVSFWVVERDNCV